jgi:hypothetical protein
VTRAIVLDERARRAWSWLLRSGVPEAIWVGGAGEVVRLREDGGADLVLPGGYPRGGAAIDPMNGGRRRARP